MENASKALIMAGGVLISIIIISLLMLMFNSLTSYQQTDVESKQEDVIIAFNQQFENYNRDDVRGNDLYSLINRVLDYNERESIAGKGENEPMTIKVDFDGKQKQLLHDSNSTNEIFTDNLTYTGTMSSRNYQSVQNLQKINDLLIKDIHTYSNNPSIKNNSTPIYFTEEALNKLVLGYDKLLDRTVINNYLHDDERYKSELIEQFSNLNSVIGIDDFFTINGSINLRILTSFQRIQVWFANVYYEYVQFKRGIFKCENIKYNKIGQIIELDFKFTGEFE